MNNVTTVLLIHWRHRLIWQGPLWALLVMFLVNLFLAAEASAGASTLAAGPLAYAMLGLAIAVAGQTFPFATSLGLRRRDYAAGAVLTVLAVSAGLALLLALLGAAQAWLSPGLGLSLSLFAPPPGMGLAAAFMRYFGSLAAATVTGLVFYAVYARFGRAGVAGLIGGGLALLTVFLLPVSTHTKAAGSEAAVLPPEGLALAAQLLVRTGLWLALLIAAEALLVWALLRRASVPSAS